MDRDVLILGIAAVLGGLSVTLAMVGIARSPFVLIVAVPLAAAAYFMWYQASGRMRERLHERASRERAAADAAEGARGARSRFAREARARMGDGGRVGANGRRRQAGPRGPNGRRGRGPTGGASMTGNAGMPPGDARRTLGVDADASESAVKSAYRERVKETHPDSGGDEEEFKRVNRAYEVLTEE
ncbi:J domain-containing protein [Halobaculum sp. CBA1158]|uniref:J domain-containing protein n=1 Tax=Halobaculum sp. CBA1158 TaxID=2904243 RepID=UPI001F15CB08|nr:J domain-containing protein [Halobaculum sp. CBA1158]UIP01039.1 J domain-containing protein [Halobaculum sp. CBA1158]